MPSYSHIMMSVPFNDVLPPSTCESIDLTVVLSGSYMMEAHALLLLSLLMNDAQYNVCADESTCMCCSIIAARCACMCERGGGDDDDDDGDVGVVLGVDGDDGRRTLVRAELTLLTDTDGMRCMCGDGVVCDDAYVRNNRLCMVDDSCADDADDADDDDADVDDDDATQ